MRRIIAALLLALGLALPVVIATPAVATDPFADTRPCADNREVNSTWAGMGRTELESRWEVSGLGVPYWFPSVGPVILYPWCDHPPGNPNGNIYYAYVGVKYGGSTGRIFTGTVVEYDCTWPGNTC